MNVKAFNMTIVCCEFSDVKKEKKKRKKNQWNFYNKFIQVAP